MILPLLVAAQLAGVGQQKSDSVYASAALRVAIASAAAANRVAPPTLQGYRAHLETEMALIIVDTLGRERTGQVEQLGGTAEWNAQSGYVAHVGGYRSQAAGVPISMVGFVRGWSLPMLYGQRLLVGIEGTRVARDTAARREARRDSLIAVHPFAADRDRYYRFTGGDTIGVMTTESRRVPIIRINAVPNLELESQFAAFDGEIDVDAQRHEIVRMRGRFVVSDARERSYSFMSMLMVKATGTMAVAYIEFVNAEYDGRYWLPATQRMEFQATIGMLGGARSVFRIVSRFSDLEIQDSPTVATGPGAYTRRRVTFAPSDSMSRFSDWRSELGSASSSVGANDFEDVAPPDWRGDGPPRVTLYPKHFDRALHYNRIEGLFTGVEVSAEMRSAAPGVVGRIHGGWAWSEQTVRGGANLARGFSKSAFAIHAERRLAGTQDFQRELEGNGSSIGALLGSIEEADYVDRWSAGISHTRAIRSINHGLLTARIAAVRDRDVAATLTHGPIRRSVFFLPNRHAANGTYALGAFGYEYHPNVSGEFLEPGFGATMYAEGAAGDLSWIRTEASLSARRYLGPVTLASRIDAGAIFSDNPPPQTLFELGGTTGRLRGYQYKEFAGDRAALFRAFVSYGFPLFRAPRRIGRILVPGLTPGVGAGVDGGWTGFSSAAARGAVLSLGDGTAANPVSRETERVRSTASLGLTFFSNSVHVGLSRPIDYPAPWRWIVGFGQGF